MTERELADNRDSMSLAERVEARRELDEAAGVKYDPLPEQGLKRLARILGPGLRRIDNQK
ncbi:hypothetical protein [Rhodococcus sp. JT-3]|uniref:hypothetical protein n=1 Tax=Rhodococcus sp. JT-3 TaxID=1973213 RepID=UPI0013036348|nr:hypothetical protein [Rhodococcus sp. JT-3]